MALRVLLADESTTIKKVIQLTLQDFAVEVKAVHVGVDVLEVARSFEPEIIFVDVLLQKKTGYEVCAELKNDAKLKNIPVVLMWSSFMDLDDKLATSCGANARLEKPFDTETLRGIVLSQVPKTHSQRLAHFLQFPPTISENLKKEEAQKTSSKGSSTADAKSAPMPTQAQAPLATPTSQATAQSPTQPSIQAPAPIMQQHPVNSAPMTFDFDLDDSPTAAPPPSRTPKPIPRPPVPTQTQPSSRVINDAEVDDENGEPSSTWDMDSFDEVDQFVEKPASSVSDEPEPFQELKLTEVTAKTKRGKTPPPPPGSEAWSHQDLSKFKLGLPELEQADGNDDPEIEVPSIPVEEPEETPEKAFVRNSRVSLGYIGTPLDAGSPGEISLPIEPVEEVDIEDMDTNARLELEQQPIPQLSSEHLEAIVRAQSREIIESLVRRLVPDIASEMIRAEIERLMSDQDSEL